VRVIKAVFCVSVLCIVWTPFSAAYTENDAARLTADARRTEAPPLAYVKISEDALADKLEERHLLKIVFALVDLRTEGDYAAGHIPGAVNIPLAKLRFTGEAMFSKEEDVIFYGYSRDDLAAVDAVILFVNKGFRHVALVEGGIAEWKGKTE